MRLLVLGRNGQVGFELMRALAPLGEVIGLERSEADFSRPETLPGVVAAVRPDVIVSAAAYTAVDKAEGEADLARRVNTESVGELAAAAREAGIVLLHYSTDYVFDGTKAAPYVETDPTNPLNVYGRTKRDGEEAIRAAGCRHLILRTSWVHAPRGANFIRTILRLAAERSELRVVADQLGAPTPASLIADVTAKVLRTALDDADARGGTYHLTAGGETSWHGLAQFILEQAAALGAELRLTPDRLIPVPTSDYPTPAARPANARLDTGKLRNAFGVTLPDWREGAKRTVQALVEPR